jgi:hypothetical protein
MDMSLVNSASLEPEPMDRLGFVVAVNVSRIFELMNSIIT